MRLLLLLPFVGLLWVPFYNAREPELFGFPFFYWYQLAWVPATALLAWIVRVRVLADERAAGTRADGTRTDGTQP